MSTYALGEKVFFDHSEESWILGTVKDVLPAIKGDKQYRIEGTCRQGTGQNASTVVTLTETVGESKVHAVVGHPDTDPCSDDLLELSYLHTSTLLHHIRRRYYDNVIYTRIGPIIVALNPYDYALPNYVDSKMPMYIAEGSNVITQKSNLLPHAWSIAHNAYWLLRSFHKNQSILVSGESGAGKTETAKIVVRYLGVVSTSACNEEAKKNALGVTTKVNMSSPILEAFGNAKTARNDNSSRFGKFMKVQFDTQGVMVGSLIEVYLLEKSRIISHTTQERSYHSFYQLVRGASQLQRQRMQLAGSSNDSQGANAYRTLNVGKAVEIVGVDDSEDFALVNQAMITVGLSEKEQQSVWDVVAGVLHAQEVAFEEVKGQGDGGPSLVAPKTFSHLSQAAILWGINASPLQAEYLTSTSSTGTEKWTKNLRPDQASDVRDALSKALYERLFLQLVTRINALISVPGASMGPAGSAEDGTWIGLLDIFGFESFQVNSFEQLCINLANETLQGHYNQIIFTRDMEECREEGIDTQSVVFYDNSMCLELLGGSKMSILTLLDDESSLSKGSDQSFFEKARDTFAAHPNFVVPRLQQAAPPKSTVPGAPAPPSGSVFCIKHYAGDVSYCVGGFRDKNNDSLKDALKLLLRGSSNAFIAELLPEPDTERRGKALTVGGLFRLQLRNLMAMINSTNPHWIRCVKPHSAKKPRMFRGTEVMTQLCCAGVLETIRIRKMSFCVRFPFAEFWRHFKNVLKRKLPQAPNGSPPTWNAEKQAAVDILKAARVGSDAGQVGKTKVFMKTEGFQAVSKLNQAVLQNIIQDVFRCVRYQQSIRVKTIKQRKHQLIQVQSFGRAILSAQMMRKRELVAKEAYMLVAFRSLIMLQTEEEKVRKALDGSMNDNFQLLVTLRRIDFEKLIEAWKEKMRQQQAKEREMAWKDALEALTVMLDKSMEDLATEVQLFTIGQQEERGRAEVLQEYEVALTELTSLEASKREAVLIKLQEKARQAFMMESAMLGHNESIRRDEIVREEAASFIKLASMIRMQLAIFVDFVVRLSFQEATERRGLLTIFMEETDQLERQWWIRKQQQDRQDMRNILALEHKLRVDMLKVEQHEIIALLTASERDFEEAGKAEYERLRAQDLEAQRAIELERSRQQQLEMEYLEQQRRVAKVVWNRALAEQEQIDDLQKQVKDASTIAQWRAQDKVQTLRSYQQGEIASRQAHRISDMKVSGNVPMSPARAAPKPLTTTFGSPLSARRMTSGVAPMASPRYQDVVSPRTASVQSSVGGNSGSASKPAIAPRHDSTLSTLQRLRQMKHANPMSMKRPPLDPHAVGWQPPAPDSAYLPDGSVVKLPPMMLSVALQGGSPSRQQNPEDLL